MKCIIPGANLKVFGKSIHALAKIGDEIYFEAMPDGLAVRTVNSSRSGYMSFLFKSTFFHKFSHRPIPRHQGSTSTRGAPGGTIPPAEEETLKCKVYTKSCLAVFKSLTNIEKLAENCKMFLDLDEDRLIFQVQYKNGLTKTFNLTFIECETLKATYETDDAQNVLLAQSKLFSEVVSNFQSNVDELEIAVTEERVLVTNFIDHETDASKILRTEVGLSPGEFDSFDYSVDSRVVFCLKEFRSLLFFCEGFNLPLSILVKEAGQPIVFVVDTDPAFEANLVLATLSPAMMMTSAQGQTSLSTKTTNYSNNNNNNASTSALASGKKPASKLQRKKITASERKKSTSVAVSFQPDGDGEETGGDFGDETFHIENVTIFDRNIINRLVADAKDVVDEDNDVATALSHGVSQRQAQRPSSLSNDKNLSTGSEKFAQGRANKYSEEVAAPSVSMLRNKRRASDIDSWPGEKSWSGGGGGSERSSSSAGIGRPDSTESPAGGGRVSKKASNDNSAIQHKKIQNKFSVVFGNLDEEEEDDDDGHSGGCGDIKQNQCFVEDVPVGGGHDDDDDDVIPGTPPRSPPNKKFRSLFFNITQSQDSYRASQSRIEDREKKETQYEVLAEDSEDEL